MAKENEKRVSNMMVITPIELPETQNAVKVFPTNYEFTDSGNRRMVRYLNDGYHVVEIPHGQEMVKRLSAQLTSDNDYQLRFDIGLAGIDTEAIIKWASEHPLLVDESGYIPRKNTRLGPASYSILLMRQLSKHKHSVDGDIMKAYVKYSSLPQEQKEAVAVFFGVNPSDLEPEELDNRMISLHGGVLTIVKENRDRFLNEFTSLFDEVSLNFKAAMLCGVVVQQSEGIYTLAKNSFILGDESLSITMLRKRDDLYSILSRELSEKGMYQHGIETEVDYEDEEVVTSPIQFEVGTAAAEPAAAQQPAAPAPASEKAPVAKGAKAGAPAGEFKQK
jgi:hypothetical protein